MARPNNLLKARAAQYSAYATLYIAIILAVLGLVNWLANRYNKSYDATANKRYSLSDQTTKVVKGLQQDVNLTYFDKTGSFGSGRELLDRYDNLSPKLHVRYVDPYKKPQLARAAGVTREGAVIVQVGDRKEEAKGLTEEAVTGALVRSLKGGARTVCAVTGSKERDLDDTESRGYSGLKALLQRDAYGSKSISLLEKAQVPNDCTVVLVGGPRFDYLPPAVNALKAYVENGGRVMFLLDPPLKSGREQIADNDALTGMLAGWGVTADKDLVLDTSGVGQILGLGPEVPLVRTYENHPIVRELRGAATAFPLVRSLQVKSGDKTTVQGLVKTTENSFATAKLDAAEINIDENRDKRGPFTLAAAGTYTGGKTPGRFVVVGSSNWAANFVIRFNGNGDLLLNMVNWLSSDEELMSIRPKDPEDRRLTLNKRQMNVLVYTSLIAFPLMAVVAGVSVWWRRR